MKKLLLFMCVIAASTVYSSDADLGSSAPVDVESTAVAGPSPTDVLGYQQMVGSLNSLSSGLSNRLYIFEMALRNGLKECETVEQAQSYLEQVLKDSGLNNPGSDFLDDQGNVNTSDVKTLKQYSETISSVLNNINDENGTVAFIMQPPTSKGLAVFDVFKDALDEISRTLISIHEKVVAAKDAALLNAQPWYARLAQSQLVQSAASTAASAVSKVQSSVNIATTAVSNAASAAKESADNAVASVRSSLSSLGSSPSSVPKSSEAAEAQQSDLPGGDMPEEVKVVADEQEDPDEEVYLPTDDEEEE